MATTRRESELVQSLKQQLQHCAGFEGDELSANRKQALDYYFQRLRGDEQPGRSAVVSGDLSAMVEANLAQMMEAFTSGRVCDFDPLDAPDKEQAALESDAVTYFVMKKNNGWLTLASAIKDALGLRNGIIKAWIETRREVRYETYSKVKTQEVRTELMHRPGIECSQVGQWKPADGLLQLKCLRTVRIFRCDAVALENFLYPKDYDSLDLQRIPFCAERHITARSELVALGFAAEVVNKLKATRVRIDTAGQARNPRSIGPVGPKPADKSQELVEWFEIYDLRDQDGDGIAERRRSVLAWADGELLADEPVNVVPYATGVALLNQHRLTGISLHDKLKQTQDKHTGLERALFDNVNASNKNRTASLDGAVNADDLADGRHNGNIRINPRKVADVRQAVMAFAVQDTSANILQNIEAVKRERAELGGAALDMASGPMQLNDRMGSQGVDRVYSVMEQLAALMTRNIAATLIRNTWLLAHATLREGWRDPVPIQRAGAWESPVPQKWRERDMVTVKPGMSPGERTRLQNALGKMLDWQVMLAEKGMDEVLVYIDGFYKLIMDWARVAEVPLPEQYFRNPQSPESKQAAQAKQQAAAQQQAQKQKLMQQAIGLEQLRTAVEKYSGDADRQFKYWDAVLKAEIEEAKIVGSATVELVKAKDSNRAQAEAAELEAGGGPPSGGDDGGGRARARARKRSGAKGGGATPRKRAA